MATLHERKNYRTAVLKALYRATGENRPGATGARLRDDLRLPEQDSGRRLYVSGGRRIGRGRLDDTYRPAMVTLTHEGIRQMEAEEQEREERG